MSFQFEYEINYENFAAAYKLYFERTKRVRAFMGGAMLLLGIGALYAAWDRAAFDRQALFLALIGTLFLGFAWAYLVRRLSREKFERSTVFGKRYLAKIGPEGFEVSEPSQSWKVEWRAVSVKAEDERVIALYSIPTIFIFGKQFLTPEQQTEIRQLAGMPQPDYVSKSSSA